MKNCEICPRNCKADRENVLGVCGATNTIKIAHACIHHWEEPIISGEEDDTRGSGAIFFSHCNLKCEYCQNEEISHLGYGKECSISELVELIKELERKGAYNINFVTPTHFTEGILEALKIYKPKIPIVWNTSGYEKPETIEKLRGFVDIFLTDLKYFSSETAEFSNAPDYFHYASKSILKMREIVGEDVIQDGFMKKGMIIRHLVLPNGTSDSVKVLDWIYNNLGENQIVSVMNQYIPCFKAKEDPKLNRLVKPIEYNRVKLKAESLGFKNVYFQESASATSEYIPLFKGEKQFKF